MTACRLAPCACLLHSFLCANSSALHCVIVVHVVSPCTSKGCMWERLWCRLALGVGDVFIRQLVQARCFVSCDMLFSCRTFTAAWQVMSLHLLMIVLCLVTQLISMLTPCHASMQSEFAQRIVAWSARPPCYLKQPLVTAKLTAPGQNSTKQRMWILSGHAFMCSVRARAGDTTHGSTQARPHAWPRPSACGWCQAA